MQRPRANKLDMRLRAKMLSTRVKKMAFAQTKILQKRTKSLKAIKKKANRTSARITRMI